jgi:hypothetical protein
VTFQKSIGDWTGVESAPFGAVMAAVTARTALPPLLITKAFSVIPTVAPRLIVMMPVQSGSTT